MRHAWLSGRPAQPALIVLAVRGHVRRRLRSGGAGALRRAAPLAQPGPEPRGDLEEVPRRDRELLAQGSPGQSDRAEHRGLAVRSIPCGRAPADPRALRRSVPARLADGAADERPVADHTLEIVINGDGTLETVGVARSSGFLPFDTARSARCRRLRRSCASDQDPVLGRPRVHALGFPCSERQCGTFNAQPLHPERIGPPKAPQPADQGGEQRPPSGPAPCRRRRARDVAAALIVTGGTAPFVLAPACRGHEQRQAIATFVGLEPRPWQSPPGLTPHEGRSAPTRRRERVACMSTAILSSRSAFESLRAALGLRAWALRGRAAREEAARTASGSSTATTARWSTSRATSRFVSIPRIPRWSRRAQRDLLAAQYGAAAPHQHEPGRIALYAQSRDYHSILYTRVRQHHAALARRGLSRARLVDTLPISRARVAARAGVGFIGKNAC